MSDTVKANQNQNSPSAYDLEARIEADRQTQNAALAAEPKHEQEAVRGAKRYPDEPVAEEEAEVEQEVETAEAEEPEVSEQKEEEQKEVKDESKEKDEDEYQERIKRLAIERREVQRQLRAAQEEIARLKGEKPPAPPDEEFQRRVEEAARAKAEAARFNDRCNDIYKQGLKEYPDFQTSINNFGQIGGLPTPFLEAVLETDTPAKVIRYLGNNLDEAERLLQLGPTKAIASLIKLNEKLNAPPPAKPQSKAPPPIRPVSGTVKAEPNIEKMPLRDFMKLEDERSMKRRRYS